MPYHGFPWNFLEAQIFNRSPCSGSLGVSSSDIVNAFLYLPVFTEWTKTSLQPIEAFPDGFFFFAFDLLRTTNHFDGKFVVLGVCDHDLNFHKDQRIKME